MIQHQWRVDDNNLVTLNISAWGKRAVQLNEKEVQRWRGKQGPLFSLSDGRGAQVKIVPAFAGRPDVELRVGGQLVRPMTKGLSPSCPKCKARIKGLDEFCASCGAELPPAEIHGGESRVKEATGMITALAVLFVISGVVMYFIQRGTADDALSKLAHLPADQVLQVEGKEYVVSELREQVTAEPRMVLIVNLMLGAIMGVLALWAKASPFPAMVVAAAIYAVVIVANAIVDPTTIAQGFLIKILAISLLYKGIKASLQIRAASA